MYPLILSFFLKLDIAPPGFSLIHFQFMYISHTLCVCKGTQHKNGGNRFSDHRCCTHISIISIASLKGGL